MTEKSVTRRVADFVTNAAHDRLPADVVHGVRRAILDSIGVRAFSDQCRSYPAAAK